MSNESIRVKIYGATERWHFLHGVWWILGLPKLLGVYKRALVTFLFLGAYSIAQKLVCGHDTMKRQKEKNMHRP